MNSSKSFLPDFGNHLIAQGSKEFRLIGFLTLNVVARYEDRFSVTGGCTQAGACYCASFDFADAAWKKFAGGLQRVLYLHPDQMFGKSGEAACALDPPLPIHVDLQGTPGPSTYSKVTGEDFSPLLVNRIGGLRLAPSHDVLEKRHKWWSRLSTKVIDEMEVDTAQLKKIICPGESGPGPLHLEEFYKNLAILRLLRRAWESKSLDAVVETSAEHGWIQPKSKQQLRRCAEAFIARLSPEKIETLRTSYVNLLVWYAGTRILAGAVPGAIETDLRNNWGPNAAADLVVHEGRCCLARLGTQPLIRDSLDEEIGQLARGHEGVRKIIEMRVAKFPAEVLDHPELSTIVEPYVRYDLFRQIHMQRPGLVNDEMAIRCEENVKTIAGWLMLFAAVEAELFGRGMEAFRAE